MDKIILIMLFLPVALLVAGWVWGMWLEPKTIEFVGSRDPDTIGARMQITRIDTDNDFLYFKDLKYYRDLGAFCCSLTSNTWGSGYIVRNIFGSIIKCY